MLPAGHRKLADAGDKPLRLPAAGWVGHLHLPCEHGQQNCMHPGPDPATGVSMACNGLDLEQKNGRKHDTTVNERYSLSVLIALENTAIQKTTPSVSRVSALNPPSLLASGTNQNLPDHRHASHQDLPDKVPVSIFRLQAKLVNASKITQMSQMLICSDPSVAFRVNFVIRRPCFGV